MGTTVCNGRYCGAYPIVNGGSIGGWYGAVYGGSDGDCCTVNGGPDGGYDTV